MASKTTLPLMEEKRPVQKPAPRRHRPLVFLSLTAIAFYGLYAYDMLPTFTNTTLMPHLVPEWEPSHPSAAEGIEDIVSDVFTTTELVPLEAHIISKCPDARDCLRDLLLPAMIKVSDKVNFTLSYIGVPTENDGVDCKHGPEECIGNIIELCAHRLYPDPKIWLGFTMCLTRDYDLIPQRELIEDCALEHAVDFDKLNACATEDDGALGMSMLRQSVKRSASLGIKTSCTVRLNNELFCVRDDGEWKDCPGGSSVNDLVIAIEKIHRSS